MGKAVGLLLAVAGIWITVEVYTQGYNNAFDGRLASLFGSEQAAPSGTTPQRVGNAVGRAHQERDARYDTLIPE